MKNSVSNEMFMEWVEQYLNDAIQPEAARQMLEVLQNDPDRLDQFCAQLQMEQILKMPPQAGENSPIAGIVLQHLKENAEPKIIRPVRWNRILLRTAAILAVVLAIGGIMSNSIRMKLGGGISELDGTSPASDQSSLEHLQTIDDQQAPANERPKMKMKKPIRPVEITKSSTAKPRSQITVTQRSSETDAYAQIDGALQTLDSARVSAPPPAPATHSSDLGGLGFSMPGQDLFGTTTRSGGDASGSVTSGRQSKMGRSPSEINTEAYAKIEENGWFKTSDKPLSTFSIDVDTASYANVRRFLSNGQLPPPDAVRIEEMINYFEYNYAAPNGNDPFRTAMALASCPWNRTHQLLRVGLQGRKPDDVTDKPSNLVFLLDVSGSMSSADKLPLLKQGFAMMVKSLGEQDRVAIVVYAGSTGLVLDSTPAADKEKIISAMNRLSAGGSTAGGAGIELAYGVAADHYIKGGINRVILATDGDFNVGISNLEDLQKLIEEKRKTGVFLSVLGFGTGNLKDSTMELLADKGNGNYFYIDSEREADKVLVKQLTANMVTIAKDVKIQIEFNPAVVRAYRLIGYENRVMAAQDFADDRKDAGEIGAGHQVTALYELITSDAPATQDGVELKYTQAIGKQYSDEDELLTLKLRYKEPEGSKSKLLVIPLKAEAPPESMDESFRWAAAVAAFGQYLRQSDHLVRYSLEDIQEQAESAVGEDPFGYRREFIQLLQRATQLENSTSPASKYPLWQYRN